MSDPTTRYRQQAALLSAQASKDAKVLQGLPSLTVAQHLGMVGPGIIPASMIEKTTSDDIYLPLCKSCASPLQPGYQDTSCRVMSSVRKRSRTQRRRDSRTFAKEKKHTLRQQQKHNHERELSKLGKLVTSSPINGPTLHRLYHNYLQVSCGVCQTKVRVAGQERKQRHASLANARKREEAAKKKMTATAKAKAASNPWKREAEDFLTLPPPTRPVATTNGGGLAHQKIKKKKMTPKSKQLLDFLSSLND